MLGLGQRYVPYLLYAITTCARGIVIRQNDCSSLYSVNLLLSVTLGKTMLNELIRGVIKQAYKPG